MDDYSLFDSYLWLWRLHNRLIWFGIWSNHRSGQHCVTRYFCHTLPVFVGLRFAGQLDPYAQNPIHKPLSEDSHEQLALQTRFSTTGFAACFMRGSMKLRIWLPFLAASVFAWATVVYWVGFIGYLATEHQLVPVVAKIERVGSGWDSISHGTSVGTQRVIKIDYSYTVHSQNFLSSSVGFGCIEDCSAQTVARILNKDPSGIEAGQTMTAWADEKQPAKSYLSKLPSGDLWREVIFGMFLLASSPFVYFVLRSLVKGNKEDNDV